VPTIFPSCSSAEVSSAEVPAELTPRRKLAQGLRWPEGALKAVRKLKADHPRYTVHWSRGGHEGPAG
jgi:hypothetical protein